MTGKSNPKPTSFSLDAELLEALDDVSHARKVTKTALVSEALVVYLKLPPPPEPKLSPIDRDRVNIFTKVLQFTPKNQEQKAFLANVHRALLASLEIGKLIIEADESES